MRYLSRVLEWIGEPAEQDGVLERRFDVLRDGARVPGVLWTPAEAAAPAPLVLLGHGGAGHKRDESRLDYARGYVASGLAAAAIDGPFHGDRAPAEPVEPEDRTFDEALVEAMVADWRATLDGLVALEEIDGARIAYGGVSMGTMFGLPFLVADRRPRAAVLGLCGLRGNGEVESGLYARLGRDAPRLRCPTLFVMQWDDELFARDAVLALYDALGPTDKRLYANPGGHAEVPAHVRAATAAFIVEQLTGRRVRRGV
jgi:dienelactone hydrolase